MSAFPSQLEQMLLDSYPLLGAGETPWKKSWLLAQALEIKHLLRQLNPHGCRTNTVVPTEAGAGMVKIENMDKGLKGAGI